MNKDDQYKKICELLGKNEDDDKFDPIKRLEELLKNRDFWKAAWGKQHTVTGLSYWNGYNDGHDESTKGNPKKLRMGFRSVSALKL
jgi:hypothetical protein